MRTVGLLVLACLAIGAVTRGRAGSMPQARRERAQGNSTTAAVRRATPSSPGLPSIATSRPERPGAWSGIVIDNATGEPIDGAEVRLCASYAPQREKTICSGPSIAAARSGPDGAFSLAWQTGELEPVAVVVKRGFTDVVVDGGPYPARVELVAAGRIHVRVVDEDGAPVDDAWVGIAPVADRSSDSRSWQGSNDKGYVGFEVADSHEVVVFASDDGRSASEHVFAVPGADEWVELRLRQVAFATVSGRVVRPDGTPLVFADVEVTASSQASDDGFAYLDTEEPSSETDGDGQFELQVPAGEPVLLRAVGQDLTAALAVVAPMAAVELSFSAPTATRCWLRAEDGHRVPVDSFRRDSSGGELYTLRSPRGEVVFVDAPWGVELCGAGECGFTAIHGDGGDCVATVGTMGGAGGARCGGAIQIPARERVRYRALD